MIFFCFLGGSWVCRVVELSVIFKMDRKIEGFFSLLGLGGVL